MTKDKLIQLQNSYRMVEKIIEQINDLTQQLMGEVFFEKCSLMTSISTSFELHFNKKVSRLYSLFNEVSKKNIQFILNEIRTEGNHENYEKLEDFTKAVNALRTFFQHHLQTTSEKWQYSVQWLNNGSIKHSISNVNWEQKIDDLLELTLALFQEIYDKIAKIYQLDNIVQDIVIFRWKGFGSNNFHYSEYEKVFISVADNLGFNNLDALKISKQMQGKWNKKLKEMKIGFSFKEEAQKIIIKYLKEKQPTPITGGDIISYYNLEKSRRVFELTVIATELYQDRELTKTELLEALREYI
jgi:hypothetical protein